MTPSVPGHDPKRARTTIFPDGSFRGSTFDPLGRRAIETDQAGEMTRFGYDAMGRLIAVTNALGHFTRYEYNEQGQQMAQIDAENRTTNCDYDTMGRRTKRVLPLGQVERQIYDAAGNLRARIDFNGFTNTFQYDASNRLTEKKPDPRRSEPTVLLSYNQLGLRTNMIDASGVTSYAYDLRNRLTTKMATAGTLLYGYDANGSVTNIKSLNTNGVNLTYSYDALNRLQEVLDPHAGITSYTYDEVGNLRGYTYPNGVNTFHQYDSLNRLTNMSASKSTIPLANYAYTVGPAGHRLSADERLLPSIFNSYVSSIDRIYQYDRTYRLTNEHITLNSQQSSLTYEYDKVGNRLSLASSLPSMSSASYEYDLNDRLSSDSYDANGNTLFASGFAMTEPDRYDFENRLTKRFVAGKIINIVYDGDGNRVKKVVITPTNTVTTSFLVDTVNLTRYAQVLEEISTDTGNPALFTPTLTRAYAFGLDLISQEQLLDLTWHVTFYGYDGLGNTRYLIDEVGAVSDSYDYEAFGNIIRDIRATPNAHLYTGEPFDSDLDLFFLRARYFNPIRARFWTRDDFEGFVWWPYTLHAFAYVCNNPVNATDPSGHITRFIYGEAVHQAIGYDFVGKGQFDALTREPLRIYNRSVGRLTGIPALDDFANRPDLIDLSTKEIYEIKSRDERYIGLDKIKLYLSLLQKAEPGSKWVAGSTYTPPPRIFFFFAYADVDPPAGGVITYELHYNGVFPIIAIPAKQLAKHSIAINKTVPQVAAQAVRAQSAAIQGRIVVSASTGGKY